MSDPVFLEDVAAGTGGFVIYGRDASDQTGYSIAGAGDINNDGFADILIGALGGDGAGNGVNFAGESYLVFGKAEGFGASIDLADVAAGTGGFVIYGIDASDQSGHSVSAAGDFNGDGFDDLLIGAAGGDGMSNANSTSGESYLVFGKADGFGASVALADIAAGIGGLVLYGRDAFDESGHSVSGAGDVNGDGFDDLVIGAWRANGAANAVDDAGEAYIVYGRAGPFGSHILLNDLVSTNAGDIIHGRDVGDWSGYSVGRAGDVNGDGFDDVLIGAPRADGSSNASLSAGEGYVLFGSGAGFASPVLLEQVAAGNGGFVIYGLDGNDEFARKLAPAGDINDDGLDDIVFGASWGDGAGNGATNSGEAYVIFGRSSSFAAGVDLADIAAGDGGFVIYGRDATDYAGFSLSAAGDFNGDGIADLLVGAYGGDGPAGATSSSGETYLVFGRADGFGSSIDLDDIAAGDGGFAIYGRDPNDCSGWTATAAGDIDGDGLDDLIIAAPWGDGPGNATMDAGEVFVLFGRADQAALMAVDDTGSMRESAPTTAFDVLANDTGGGTLQGIGSKSVSSPVAAITAADVTVAIVNRKIAVTLGDDFAKLGAGQNATITIPYSIRDASGETASATLTITVTGEQGTVGNDELNLTGTAGGTAAGGKGNDTYVVDDPLDNPVEFAGQGVDTVQASLSWTLGANLDKLVLVGVADLSGTGNTLANTLLGNSGDNTLDGGAGPDTLRGGEGDDVYYVDDAGDLVVEGAPAPAFAGRIRPDGSGANIDTVIAQISYTLRDNVENLELAGSVGLEAFGNTLANRLTGNTAANLLQGKAGNDTLDGGAGIDVATYSGAKAGYSVVANGATVTVTDTNAADGDEGVDVLTGFEALRFSDAVQSVAGTAIRRGDGTAQTLDLRASGAQAAAGGAGNDIYLVNARGDAAIELAGAGTDTVKSPGSWRLWENLENLELLGNLVADGAGNNSANAITGNSAANRLSGFGGGDTLDGGAGADTLIGGPGNDLYIVGAGDVLEERADEGTDTVRSAQSRTLGANLENLTLTGSSGLSGSGNAAANALTGNSGANTLSGLDGADTLGGGGGNDVLKGGAGNDKLSGGAGADAFVFETALSASANRDTVADFLAGTDKLRLDDDVFTQIGATGALAAAKFFKGAGVTAAHDADDRIVYNTSTGILYYDPDGTGSKAAVAFAVLGTSTHPAITAADFLIVG